MTEFGDYDPADAWDIDDDPDEQVANLLRRLAARLVERSDDVDLVAVLEHVDVIAALVAADDVEGDAAYVPGRL